MTAPVWASKNVLDNGLAYIKTKCNAVILVDYAYAAGDSYATVRGTADANIVAERTGVTGTDITLADQGTNGRKATIAAPVSNPTAVRTSSGTAGFLKYAALDTVGTEVLAVFDVTNDQVIVSGNPVLMSALVFNMNQPTG
jgi:hypothetical protein